MKITIYKHIFLIITVLMSINVAIAQQDRYDARVGIHVGVMNYYGDLNEKFIAANDRLRDFKLDFLSYGLSVERNLFSSWSAKIQYNRGQFIANDRAIKWDGSRDFDNSNDARSLNAKTDIDDFSLMFTYYTDNGKLFSKNALIAPYLSFGVGLTHFEVFADLRDGNGNFYNYWSDNTIRDLPESSPNATIIEQDGSFETNVSALETEEDYNTTVLNIPIGVGLKFRLAERLNLNLDYTLRYTFTDYLDDVSGNYREEYSSELQAYAANPTNALAEQRGDDSGNDLYGFASISLHFSFGKKERAFEAPVINYSGRYDQNLPRRSEDEIDKVSAKKGASFFASGDSAQIASLPNMDRKIREVQESPVARERTRDFSERRNVELERADTLDSLSYLVQKQGLENELYKLKLSSPDPEVRLKTKEDSLRTAEAYFASAQQVSDTVVDDTLRTRRENLDQQLEVLDRRLQRIMQNSDRTPMVTSDTVLYADSSQYSFSEKYNRQIDSLEHEVDSLQHSGKYISQAELDSLRRTYDREENASEERMEVMEADTAQAAAQENTSDSLAIAKLEERYKALEQRIQEQADTEQDQDENSANSASSTSSAERQQLDELEREIAELRRERDYPRYTSEGTTVEAQERNNQGRIAQLEREVESLRARNSTLAVSASPATGRDADENERLEAEMQQTQQMIDSLQQQIAGISSEQRTAKTPSDSARVYAEVEALKQEISALRANIVAMDEENAGQPENPAIPEMPKTEVFFKVGASTLSESDKERISTLVQFIKKYPEATVELRGYTDPTGSPSRNLVLSKRRAESVKQVLIEGGIAEERISSEFFGADNNATGELSYGRRVEIRIE